MAYTGNAFSQRELYEITVDAVAVLIHDRFSINQKRAAILLLKALIPHAELERIVNDNASPFERHDSRVKEWAKIIVSRGRCERCGAAERLEAHHVLRWSDYPKGRADVKNGECLCHACHTEEHSGEQVYYMMKATL